MSKKVLKLAGALLDNLPENYYFDGTLDLTGSFLTKLPKGLYVTGDLILGDKIVEIPPEAIIGGDVYFSQSVTNLDKEGHIIFNTLSYDLSSIVCGKIYFEKENISYYKPSNKTNYIILDNGDLFWYKDKKYYTHQARNHEFDRTPFDFYTDYSNERFAVQWSTPQGTFTKKCKDKKDAKFLVNYQDAIERGLEQYKGLDIDTPMLGHKILDIYQVCTHSCMPVIQEYLDTFGLSLDKKYTLREIGYKIQKFKIMRYAPASEVFMYFFNIPNYEKETE